MFTNEILPPGEKVKKIRKVIGASQQDIAGNQITRNLISQIENGKTNLVLSTAEIICNNIKIFMKKHVNNSIKNLEITPELLLEDEETQANNIAEKYLKELRKLRISTQNEKFEIMVQDIEKFLEKWNVSYKLRVEVYEVISDVYFNYNDYNKSILRLQNSLDITMRENDYENSLRIMLDLSKRVYINGGDALQQLMTMHSALNLYTHNNLNNKDLLKRIYFNFALYYSEVNMHNNSIEFLDKLFEEFDLSIKESLDVKLLKANCYEETRQYKLAEELYLNILDLSLEKSSYTITSKVYNSLGSLYRLAGEYENSLKYINHSIKIKDNIDERNYAKTLYYALENYIEMDCEELVIKNYSSILNYLDRVRNNNLYYNLSIKLYDYFIIKKEYENVFDLLRKVEISIKRKIIMNKDSVTLFFKASHELKSNELFEKGIELLKFF